MDVYPLSDDDQWRLVVKLLRTATGRMVDELDRWLNALPAAPCPPSPEGFHQRIQRLQARLNNVPWALWEHPADRGSDAANLARQDLAGALLAGRSLAVDFCGHNQANVPAAQALYRCFDDWHNVPAYLRDVPQALSEDRWEHRLLVGLVHEARAAHVEQERQALRATVANVVDSGAEAGARPRRSL